MASLDAHSLFTNIPVLRTTDIIVDYVYHHPTLPPPKIPKTIMKVMLLACTIEAPLKCPQESKALLSLTTKPHLYLRYVNNIFVYVSDVHVLEELRSNLQAISELQFSTELNVNNKIPFLDVLVDATSDNFKTMVYCKPTDNDRFLEPRRIHAPSNALMTWDNFLKKDQDFTTLSGETPGKELTKFHKVLQWSTTPKSSKNLWSSLGLFGRRGRQRRC
ncbi:uncharacterized protein LOC143017581 [Oratosquilla oratoria]|uniref:uncharacterized protein LOC143017581 n=1 Tax=Oratosquilla oratoria TaxID=337810 RepID=UPI003F76A892